MQLSFDILTLVMYLLLFSFAAHYNRRERVGNNTTKALILMNLGSPASTGLNDVKNYLSEFLMDERVIDYPYLTRLLLVRGIIVPFRTSKSSAAYKTVWTEEGSPLITLTANLVDAVQQKTDIPVFMAMRYGKPTIKQAFDEIATRYPDVKEVILLPLYPHYAMSSYETAIVQAEEVHKKGGYSFETEVIKPFYNETGYINALSESIRPYLEQKYDQILFSYHGLPERHIKKSDTTGTHCLNKENCCNIDSAAHKTCYRHQCFTTTQLVAAQLNIPEGKYGSSFQSRLGRSEWLKPYTADLLTKLPANGIKNLLVVCPAFVSDCLETLQEMGIEGREAFLKAGGSSFTLIPCLNTHSIWVDTIANWVREINSGNKESVLQ